MRLLKANYREGDYHLIEHTLDLPADDAQFHSLGLGVINVIEAHLTAEAIPCLLRLYEREPCSVCRGWVVDILMKLDALPEWMREECRWDVNPDTRKAVEQAKTKPPL